MRSLFLAAPGLPILVRAAGVGLGWLGAKAMIFLIFSMIMP
jgi:hypothetical protein